MFVFVIVIIGVAISSAVGSPVRDLASISTCRSTEFACLDGTCINAAAVCNNNWDCSDGSDEASCYSSLTSILAEATVFHGRSKRQLQCALFQWQCTDGTCISINGQCDGKIDCPDKSDETNALCRNTRTSRSVQSRQCVLPAYPEHGSYNVITGLGTGIDYDATPGQELPEVLLVISCDKGYDVVFGRVAICANGTWSTPVPPCIRGCVLPPYPEHGTYASLTKTGYDQTETPGEELYNVQLNISCEEGYGVLGESTVHCQGGDWSSSIPQCVAQCSLPALPEYGSYTMVYGETATAGQGLEYLRLNVSCDEGYGVVGDSVVSCRNGNWSTPIPQCVPFCKLDPDISVLYHCQFNDQAQGRRPCKSAEPVETVAIPECTRPNYFPNELRHMRCQSNGQWDHIVKCLPGQCVLPAYPEHGTYTTVSHPGYVTAGQGLLYVQLNISCEKGYGVVGDSVVICLNGTWITSMPRCVPFCKLNPHVSVHYYCQLSGQYEGRRLCKSSEPVDTVVMPECKRPNYFSNDLRHMRCESDGQWNRIVKCLPECGRVTPSGNSLIINGKTARRGEVPWHVAVYRKPTQMKSYYELICGGSIVSNSVVISAGHCFWGTGMSQTPSKYSVATAKLFKDWDHPDDTDVQKSELISIELPDHFKGASANYQSDIAILILETPFVYYTYVRPVCLGFRSDFNDHRLEKGDLGKVAGFGLTGEKGPASPVLKVVDLPYVPPKECYRITPISFTESITEDKICAGYNNGTAALCMGDSGGGLCFPESDFGITRFYIRGVVSTAPQGPNECNPFTVVTFTEIRKHKDFINQFL